ncbi:MAG: hypothetical protein AAF639_20845 [Chloroflexota bacterium]
MNKQTIRGWYIPIAYMLLTLLFYAPILSGFYTFPDGDFTHHFLPFSLFQHEAMLSGTLPVWNPYTYGGHPFLADIQAAVFYPISNLVLLITLPFTSPGARLYFLQLEAMLHIALAGYFVYLFIYVLTQNRWAAFLGGCIFAFSGYLTSYPPVQLAVLRTAIWLPLLLYLLLRAIVTNPQSYESTERPRFLWWILASIVYAISFLAGHPQTFLHITYVTAAWLLYLFLTSNSLRSLRPLRFNFIGILIFIILTLLLTAAQLLPTIEFTQLSVRADVGYDFVSGGFLLQDTWQLILPGIFTQYSPIYIGVIGLGLACCALGASPALNGQGTRPYATITFFVVLTVLALLISYGNNGFVYAMMHRFAPGWNLFRGQERVAYLVTFGLSVLAAYGAATLAQTGSRIATRNRRRALMCFAFVVIVSVYGCGLLWQLNGYTAVGQWQYLAIAAVTMVLAMVFVVMLWWDAWLTKPWLPRSLIVLTLFNLFWFNMGTNISSFSPDRKTILAPEMEALGVAVEEAEGKAGGRVYNEFRVYEDYGMRQQIEDVWGSSPLRLARYVSLFEEFPLDRMWRLMDVKHVLTWRRELFGPSELLAEFPQQRDTTFLHKLPHKHLKAWFVYDLQYVGDDEAWALLADHQFDLETTALLPKESEQMAISLGEDDGQEASVHVTRLAHNRFQIETQTSVDGLLVLSENWMPGWATRNADFEVLRANLTLLGIPIPAGEHTFALVYWPSNLSFGLWLSGGAVFGLLLIGLWLVRPPGGVPK